MKCSIHFFQVIHTQQLGVAWQNPRDEVAVEDTESRRENSEVGTTTGTINEALKAAMDLPPF